MEQKFEAVIDRIHFFYYLYTLCEIWMFIYVVKPY